MDASARLNFNDAMRDFQLMFPDVSPELIENVLRANNGAVDDTIDQLLTMDEMSMSHLSVIRDESGPADRFSGKVYNPPLVGRLPHDFLRFQPDDRRTNRARPNGNDFQSPPPPYSSVVQHNYSSYQSHEPNALPSCCPESSRSNLTPESYVTRSLPRNSSSPNSMKPVRYQEATAEALKLQTQIVAERLAENERKRTLSQNSQLESFLEDERLALLLQNEEFLLHLKNDPDFIEALERDERLARSAMKSKTTKIAHHASSRGSKDSSSKNCRSPIFTDELDPFPYTKILPKPDDMEPNFSNRLKFMGKDTKQKFTILAGKFVRKTKGIGSLTAIGYADCSNARLLSDQDINRVTESRCLISDEERGFKESETGYNQSGDHHYNIGHTTDLKQGHLFSIYK